MSTETKQDDRQGLVVSQTALSLREDTFEALHRQARALSPSSLIPKHLRGKDDKETLANVTLVLAYGSELGLGAVASLSGIAVVNGRPFAESQTLAAAVRASGRCAYLKRVSASDKSVTWETQRNGDPSPEQRTFTWGMAEKAGLAGRDTYKAHPERMLSARALGWLLRDVYPDVTKGLSTEVEHEDVEHGHTVVLAAPLGGVAGAKEAARKALEARTASTVAAEVASSEPDEAEKAAILAGEMAQANGSRTEDA